MEAFMKHFACALLVCFAFLMMANIILAETDAEYEKALTYYNSGKYKEAIEKLGEYEVVPEKFAKENADMAKFRNLLVHEYGIVDLEQVYNNLQKAPDIFRQFAEYYIDFLEKTSDK